MIVVPEPVPLEMPPEDPAALEDFVEDVAGTAYRLAVVSTCLGASSTATPHWHGADASAAATQVGVVASLAEELSGGVAAAAHRLRAHHDLLIDVRRRITRLRSEQDEDFAVAWGRLSRIDDYQLVVMTDGPQALGIVEDLRAAEGARRREHDRLLEELADDAAAAARVMADACRVVCGTGRGAGTGSAVAFLAAELPGWGDAELRRRGADLAEALGGGPVTPEEMNALARGAVPYAGSAAFGRGLFAGLGVDGVRWLVAALGSGTLGPSSDVARVLAAAFGSVTSNGRADDPVAAVLTATYVAPDDRYGDSDIAAVGLAALLLAGRAQGGMVRPETAARWARQMLARERAQGVPAGAGAVPTGWDPRALAPAELAFAAVAAGGESMPAAELLADREAWDTVLSRFWGDGGIALAEVVALAGAAPGVTGHVAVRSGLAALGAGLSDNGDPANWTVRQEVAAAVAGSLGAGVAGHLSVATDVLQTAAAGTLGARDDDVLRGLGYLTLDRAAAVAVQSALLDWMVGGQPLVPGAADGKGLVPAAVAAGAFTAVQEYGQRLAHAIHGFEAQAAAELAETSWNWTWGLAANLVLGRLGPVAGIVEGFGAILSGADGTFHVGTDDGLRFDPQTAAREVLAELGPERAALAVDFAGQAGEAFDRTAEALGSPRPPTSPPTDWLEPVLDAVADFSVGRSKATEDARRDLLSDLRATIGGR